MKAQRTLQGLHTVVRHFQDVVAFLGALTLPGRLAPVPVPVRRRSATGAPHRTPPSRLTGWLLLAGFALLAASTAGAEPPGLPAGVPNIYDPAVRGHLRLAGVANLASNPDFPVLLLVNTVGEQPRAVILGLDARNGKETWSLPADPIILIVVLSDATTIREMYVDTGFADLGKASGTYAAVAEGNPAALADLLKKVPAAVTGPYI